MENNVLEVLRTLLWAKQEPYKSLVTHMVESGIVAQQLLKESCFRPVLLTFQEYLNMEEEQVLSLIGYIVSLHDIGKIHPSFIRKNESCLEKLILIDLDCAHEFFRHEKYGRLCLRRIWRNMNLFNDYKTRENLAYVIELHHQGKKGGLVGFNKESYFESLQDEYERKMFAFFNPPSSLFIKKVDAFCTLLSGIVILSDWISSGTDFENSEEFSNFDTLSLQTKEKLNNFLVFNHMLHNSSFKNIKYFNDLWNNFSREQMRPLQRKADEIFSNIDEKNVPDAVLIEAPMGEGKTETALYMTVRIANILHKEGFYIGLPTSATSEQMYRRANDMLERLGIDKANLMHSMAWVIDDASVESIKGEDANDKSLWTKPLRRGLISPFAVGTVDQVMMSVLMVKYGVLRLAGLSQKVLIIDEMHSYDAYMTAIIKILLKWCRELEIPVIILSATLSSKLRKDIISCYYVDSEINENWHYPSFTFLYGKKSFLHIPIEGSSQRNNVKVSFAPWLLVGRNQLCDHLVAKLNKTGGFYCVIRNTVQEAQETYRILKEKTQAMKDIKIILFHARFTAKRREEITNECMNLFKGSPDRQGKVILVATQVVEQSLDLDFDYLVTDICPIDLLLQRIGRLWRHKDSKRPDNLSPEVLVLVSSDGIYGVNGKVYYETLLQRTENILVGKSTLVLPDDISLLVEEVYDENIIDTDDFESWSHRLFDEESKKNLGEMNTLGNPSKVKFSLRENAKTDFASDDDIGDGQFSAIKTRLGDPSVRIALLSSELFDSAVKRFVLKDYSNIDEKELKNIAQEVLLHSISVNEKKVKFLLDAVQSGKDTRVVQGNGLLYGVIFVKAENDKCVFDKNFILHDNELGFLSGKEK